MTELKVWTNTEGEGKDVLVIWEERIENAVCFRLPKECNGEGRIPKCQSGGMHEEHSSGGAQSGEVDGYHFL